MNKGVVSFLNLVLDLIGDELSGIQGMEHNGFPPANCGNDISNRGMIQMAKHLGTKYVRKT